MSFARHLKIVGAVCCLLLPCAVVRSARGYTEDAHIARQNERLQLQRMDQDFDETYGCLPECIYQPHGVLLDLMVELEAQKRGLAHPRGVVIDDEKASEVLAGAIAAMRSLMGLVLEPNPPEWPGGNGHSVIDAAMYAAYILHRFPAAAPNDDVGSGWSTNAWDDARVLLKWANYPYAPAREPYKIENPLSNNNGAHIAMRLLAGEVFDDPDMVQRARWAYAQARAEIARRGFAGEPHAPFYAGRVITQLALALDTHDPVLGSWIRDLLETHLIAAAHTYMPGGAVGAPQQRDRGAGDGGGITDPDPTDQGTGLLQQINMLIFDEELDERLPASGKTYTVAMLATNYHAPDVIQSLFLDKGSESYVYKHRTADAWYSGNGCCGRGYRSTGWQGWNPGNYTIREEAKPDADGSTNLYMQPGYSFMLKDGRGSIGGFYGDTGNQSPSWAAYVKDPDAAAGFSILYQRQPAEPGPEVAEKHLCEADPLPWNPLYHDATWIYEEKDSFRRMSWENAQIAIYDATQGTFHYTEAHLPQFMRRCQEVVADGDPNWWVGRPVDHGAGPYPYMAYKPLGTWTHAAYDPVAVGAACGDTPPADPYVRIELSDPISGYIAEISASDDYADEAEYCVDLAGRQFAFNQSSLENARIIHGLATDGVVIELRYADERRTVVDHGDFNVLDPEETFGTGLIESPFVTWDEQAFTLTLERDVDGDGENEIRVLDFGDPTYPAPPVELRLHERSGPSDPIRITWDHSWNDAPNDYYSVLRNAREIVQIPVAATPLEFVDDGLCAIAYTSAGITDIAKYSVRAVDAGVPAAEPSNQFETYLVGATVHGDVTPPTTPEPVSTLTLGSSQILVWWPAASDNWEVDHYRVVRNAGGPDEVVADGLTNPWLVDIGLSSSTTYRYTVVAVDRCGLVSDWTIEVQATTDGV